MNYNTRPELYLEIRTNLLIKGRCVFHESEIAQAPIGVFDNEAFAIACLKRAGFKRELSKYGY